MSEATEFGVAPPGYRLPAASHPDSVVLQIADLDRSLDYYTRILGLAVLEHTGGRALLGSHAAGAPPLVELRQRRDVTPAPRGRRFGLFHFAILLPGRVELGRFFEHLLRLAIRPGMSDHFVSEALYLYDPDGLGIEVYADRPRANWRALNQEVLMTVDPLDVRGLVAAGAGARWTGAPSGTVLGHVHLHVGDLDRADTFYHRALGFDRTAWGLSGARFFAVGGYHHHLGVNTWAAEASPPGQEEARLVEWRLGVPKHTDASAAARNAEFAGHETTKDGRDWLIADPWGTVVRLHGQ